MSEKKQKDAARAEARSQAVAEKTHKAEPATGDAADEAAEQAKPAEAEEKGDQITTLLIAIVIALLIRALIVEPFRIPSGSMFPTLLEGDHLFVNKFAYGAKIPFTSFRLPALREPQRGDIVVFKVGRMEAAPGICPIDQCPEKYRSENFVKRLVGLPGDTIEVRDGVLFVNGAAVLQDSARHIFEDSDGRLLEVIDEKNGECSYWVADDPNSPTPPRDKFTVPDGRYFMMGDNRDHSNDSRFWGTIRLNEMKGPAAFMYWSWESPQSWAKLFNPVTWWNLLTQKMRWERMGQPLDCNWPETPPASNNVKAQ